MSRLDALRWSLRRLRMSLPRHALVLEVGSGGNPYPRANVLLDAYEQTRERHWEPLVHDRPTVLAFGERLPFKDKAFDYVIAAHVLEHTADPGRFLHELQRVASAGYIETPDAFMERVNPYEDHRLEVTVRDDCLLIRKKHASIVDEELVELYEHRAKQCVARELIPTRPWQFHVRYFWKDKIDFRVLNPEVDASWPSSESRTSLSSVGKHNLPATARQGLLHLSRLLFAQRGRNRALDIVPILRCVSCQGGLVRGESALLCVACELSYDVRQGIFVMQKPQSTVGGP